MRVLTHRFLESQSSVMILPFPDLSAGYALFKHNVAKGCGPAHGKMRKKWSKALSEFPFFPPLYLGRTYSVPARSKRKF